jgi:hydrophobic/amphiphilic exporter-1 (mainly G- bacteria), HAE1 family
MKIFVERPIAAAMLYLALMVLGIYSFLNIPIELAPKEEYPQLNINASWPSVPPRIIQTQITAPIEEQISSVKGIKKITSSSSIGRAVITLEFEPDTNMEFAHLALKEKLSSLKEIFPEQVKPRVEPYVPEEFQTEPFLQYTISGNYSLNKLRELVKDKLEIGIGSIQDIAQVTVTGGADSEIQIILDKEKLKTLNIHPYLVFNRMQERIQTFPAGKIHKDQQEYIFKVEHSVSGLHDLENTLIIRSGINPTRLQDIADIKPDYGEVHYINRINGQPTISMTIHKEKGTSTLKLARRVKQKIEEIKQELPPDLVFRSVNDESEEIDKNLNELYLLVGIIVTVIFFLIFIILRSVQPSLLVLSSIFFSVLITFNLIYFFDISLNMLTLGGLALGFGLFVDNSIVVFENILRKKEKGMPSLKAAVEGSKDVFMPVLASTLTTISVFFSFAYFQGRLKIFYLPVAVVIASALAASLLVSFSLIPALSPKLLIKRRSQKKPGRFYPKLLRFVLRHPLEIILIVSAIFYGSYIWFKSEVSLGEFFRWYNRQILSVHISMPPGTEIEQTDEVIHQFEEKVLDKAYEKTMNTTTMAEMAYLQITFPPEIENSYRPYLLKEELVQLATNFAGISVSISGFDPQAYYSSMGTNTYYGSRIKFLGYNLKKLSIITADLERTLKRNPRINDVKIVSSRYGWWRLESFEYVMKIDREAVKRYALDPNYLYAHISAVIQGRVSVPMKVTMNSRELELSIKFPDASTLDMKELEDELIQTQNGEYLRLGDITTVTETPIAGSIDRENQQFQQTLMWEFRGPYKAADRYEEAVYEKLELPAGFSATREDDRFMTEEEKGQISFAIIFSLVIIFMILASLYESLIQPFFILLAVPLALIGVFIAFVIADFPFDSSAYVGVILLGGIVVNNSILLVDHINYKRKKGLPLLDSVIEGSRERVRPIFMTTSTTILGMLPMVLIQVEVGRRKIWASLALSAVGGLATSALFILIVIPVLYFHGDNLKTWFVRKSGLAGQAWRSFHK